jgi:F-type H+-transporting ATPase subunit delta
MPSAVAARYANALADAVLASASGADARASLTQLRAFNEMAKSSAELRNVLLSPAVSNTRKRAVISRFAPVFPLSPIVRNFLFVLIDRRRTDLLEDIIQAFEAVLDARMGIVRAEVRSAAPLNEQQQGALQHELSRVSSKQVRCDFVIDPSLIGGVVARIGSTVYDGSVRTQLESLRERLIAR